VGRIGLEAASKGFGVGCSKVRTAGFGVRDWKVGTRNSPDQRADVVPGGVYC